LVFTQPRSLRSQPEVDSQAGIWQIRPSKMRKHAMFHDMEAVQDVAAPGELSFWLP